MVARFDGAGLGPAEQLIGRDGPLAHLQMLFRVVRDTLSQLVGMGQEEVDVEGARCIEHLDGGSEGGSFVGIGSSLVSLAQVKEQFRCPYGLSHLPLPVS